MSDVERCVHGCAQCAGLFRLGRHVEAAMNMLEVFEAVDGVMAQRSVPDRQQWSQLLVAMLACQQADNWLGLADYMEYELAVLLRC